MRRMLVVAVLALMGGGCGFAQGFRDEGARQAAEIVGEVVDGKLDGVKDALDGFKDAIPKPTSPVNDGLLYSAGALLAYIVGSFGKGKIREAKEKRARTA